MEGKQNVAVLLIHCIKSMYKIYTFHQMIMSEIIPYPVSLPMFFKRYFHKMRRIGLLVLFCLLMGSLRKNIPFNPYFKNIFKNRFK